MSRGVRLRDLELGDLLDLCHYAMKSQFGSIVYLASMDDEARNRQRELDLLLTEGRSKEPGAPLWWHDDDEASASGLLAASQFGFRVDLN